MGNEGQRELRILWFLAWKAKWMMDIVRGASCGQENKFNLRCSCNMQVKMGSYPVGSYIIGLELNLRL